MEEGHDICAYYANEMADKLADVAAEEVASKIPWAVYREIKEVDKQMQLVQKRIACIVAYSWATHTKAREANRQVRLQENRVPVAVRLEKQQKESQHVIQTCGQLIKCKQCWKASNRTQALQWVKEPCIPAVTPRAHETHLAHLVSYRGLLVCLRCGSRSQGNRLCKITQECKPPTYAGKQTIKAIERDKLPSGMSKWPEDVANDLNARDRAE